MWVASCLTLGGNVDTQQELDGSTGATADTAEPTDRSEAVEQSTTTGSRETPGTDDRITDADVFEVLSNRRRRYALHYLMQHPDDPVEMGDLSTQVAAWEEGIDPEAVTYDQRKSVHTSLYQYHAPKLDETGLIEYDSRGGVLELTDAGSDIDLYLEAVRGREIPWASYFVLLSVLSAAFVGAAALPIPPLAGVSTAACAGAVVAVFLVSSLVFAYDNRTAMRFGSAGPPPGVDD
jgi:hypothetical protein